MRVRLFEDDGKPANSDIPDSKLPSARAGFAVVLNAVMCNLSDRADFLLRSGFACYLLAIPGQDCRDGHHVTPFGLHMVNV